MKLMKIEKGNLAGLIEHLKKDNFRVIGVTPDGKRFSENFDETLNFMQGDTPPTSISFKEHFFPKTEALFYYKNNNGAIDLKEPVIDERKTVVIGARPCDTASLPILSKVFNWDYADDFFNRRVENSIIIGMKCNYQDDYCFCNEVGLSQNSEKGSDIFLIPDGEAFIAKTITDKGNKFIEEFANFFEAYTGNPPAENKNGHDEKKFDYESVKKWLDNNFEHKFWDEAGETCLSCGQCAFVCPTCHCFDIVDEQCGTCAGVRAKNWDACQFSLFTKHASGHNPRDSREKRYRQRISHKFKYYNDKFSEILCTGCGRCSRGCPVSTDILELLEEIDQIAHSTTN